MTRQQPEFANKIALITGSSQGIGRAIGLQFAEQGAFTLVTYCRNKKKGEQVIAKIEQNGGKGALLKLDMQSSAAVEETTNAILSKYGHIDILVNNAGISGPAKPIIETPLEDWKNLLDVNLNNIFLLTKLVLPGMLEKKQGRIINISSIAYRKHTPNTASYNVSKAGLNSLTKTLSKEVGRYGITVNAIAPGLVLTDRIKNDRLPGLAKASGTPLAEIENKLLSDTDTKRFSTEGDIASAALFLASDAAKNITGEILNIAGGF